MKDVPFLKENCTIGLVAPSFGCTIEPYKSRLENAIKNFEKLGYKIKVSKLCYTNLKVESAPAKERANEFMRMWLDDEVDFIFSVGGGEVMIEMLPYLDFEVIKKSKPKYFMGFSDNTCLSFVLPTLCDIPALYGPNFPEFGPKKWDSFLNQNYDFLSNKITVQHSFDAYQVEDTKNAEGHYLDNINPTVESRYRCLDESKRKVVFEGRMIGGCLDVISLLIGTPFDKVNEFIERYKDEGIIFFFESCDLSIISQLRAYWQLRQLGWFKYCRGIIIGRPLHKEPLYDITYKEVLERAFENVDFPVIYDADIGHIPPIMTLVNGSHSIVSYRDGKGTIEFIRNQ